MASHGGMIGFSRSVFITRGKYKLPWTNLGDALVVAAPLGLFFGRCANFINGELYGRPTNVSWAMQFPKETCRKFARKERCGCGRTEIDLA